MRTLGQLAALAVTILLSLAAPALADHMNGRYAGGGMSAGTVLNLTQQGTIITGDFSGELNGTFYGQTDGGNFAEGFLTEGDTSYPYYLNWSAEQLVITLYDTMGNQLSYAFAPEGSHAPLTTTTETHEPDGMQLAEVSFYVYANGMQSGPFTLQETIGKILSGEIAGDTLVWLAGTPEWVPAASIDLLAEALPPPQAGSATYYAALNDQPVGPLSLDDVITMINEGDLTAGDLVWTEGMEAWQPAGDFAEFVEALAPEPEVPPQPPTTQPDNPPPPPPPTTPDTPLPPATGDDGTSTTTPPTTTNPPNDAGDPFVVAVRNYVRRLGVGGAEDAVVTCMLSGYSVLTPEERQIMADSDLMPSPSQMRAIDTAHPEIAENMQACFDSLVN